MLTFSDKEHNMPLHCAVNSGALKVKLFLTLQCLVDSSALINWASPLPLLGVSGIFFHFCFISNRKSCLQAVKTLVRRRVLIWVCTVCLCPFYWTRGTSGLIYVGFSSIANVHGLTKSIFLNRMLASPEGFL